ncbi:hypothetical protein [Endozoicomonas sp. 2B-B]
MIPSNSTKPPLLVTGSGKPTTEPDQPETARATAVDAQKTSGLDNPTSHGAARPLASYSIESSDDESEDSDDDFSKLLDEYLEGSKSGILKLFSDDREWVDMDKNVQALRLVNSLFLVHVPDQGQAYKAWYISGMDLHNIFKPELRDILGVNSRLEAEASDDRVKTWKEFVQETPGTSYLCGPNADDKVRDFFDVDPVNVTKTKKGPVTVTFDIATRSFQ